MRRSDPGWGISESRTGDFQRAPSPARGVEVAAYDSRGHEVSISLGHTDDQGRYSLKVKPGKLTLRTVDPTDGGIGYFHGKAKVTAKKGTSVAAPTITVKGP